MYTKIPTYVDCRTNKIFIGKLGKYKRGDRVNFLYVSKESTYFEENVVISNTSWEDPMLRSDHELIDKENFRSDKPITYYFMNTGGRIQGAWIEEAYVYPLDYKLPGILYDGDR